MAKREFLMLAQTFNPEKINIGGWFVSMKLDGVRAFWDGGISRGILAGNVPWANVEKNNRYRSPVIATGLWSRYGNVIHAPSDFLDQLPGIPLDGELWLGLNRFQETVSLTSYITPSRSWNDMKYVVFDIPPYPTIFADGHINVPNFKKYFFDIKTWVLDREVKYEAWEGMTYDRIYEALVSRAWTRNVYPISQLKLFNIKTQAESQLNDIFNDVVSQGHEGVMLRRPNSFWKPERTYDLLKLKPLLDDEGVVTGYIWGKGKLEGMMGALIVDYNGKRLELSGFTDKERKMVGQRTTGGEEATSDSYNPMFPIGSRVTFKYAGLTNDGVPRSARFFRKAN